MRRYQLKPFVIEAVQWTVALQELPLWFSSATADGTVTVAGDFLKVWTREGIRTAKPGDWIVRNETGEISSCESEIFLTTYEPVLDDLRRLAG